LRGGWRVYREAAGELFVQGDAPVISWPVAITAPEGIARFRGMNHRCAIAVA